MKITKNETGTTEVFEKEGLTLRCMSDVEIQRIKWIWKNWLPRGKLILIGGPPGIGKTTLVIDVVAAETSGRNFPFSESKGGGGTVIFISAEDDPEDTLKPRLAAAGADMERVSILDFVPSEDGKKYASLLLSRDLDALETTLRQRPEISMIVFDPLSAFMGAKDSHRDSDVREVLGPVCQLAAKYGVCIVGITHLNKNEGASAMARFMGSTGIVAAARGGFLVAPYKDALILVPVKNNLGEKTGGIRYEIQTAELDIYSPAIMTSRAAWLGEADVTADEVLAASNEKESHPKEYEAEEFLCKVLRDGPVLAKAIYDEAELAGIAKRTLKRAKQSLNLYTHKTGLRAGWKWYTPEQEEIRRQAASTTHDPLRKQGKAGNPQHPIFDPLRKENPLKAKQDNGSAEGGQLSEIYPDFSSNQHPASPDSTKGAKCTGLGNEQEKRLL